MKKRLLAILLAAAMIASVTPFALAAGNSGSSEQTESSVAKVGDTYYDTLADAFTAIETEGTVELVADATVNVVINVFSGKTVTLDLGNYQVTPTERSSSGKIFRNYGTFTIKGDTDGVIDATSKDGTWSAIENDGGTLNILSGTIKGNDKAIAMKNAGTVNISGGSLQGNKKADAYSGYALQITKGGVVTISGDAQLIGVDAVVDVQGGTLNISNDAYLSGEFGVLLRNLPNTNDTTQNPTSATLTMTGGTIEATTGFALAGNNTQSAQCNATITGGTLRQTGGETCIYWPMEGTLTIGGDAVVEGATGIEAKMGTINIQDDATIRGTGEYLEQKPFDGGSEAEGSALLVSAEMYGANEGQYITSPDIKVNITGGMLESQHGNAVTTYITEDTSEQAAAVTIENVTLTADNGAAIKVVTDETKTGTTQTNAVTEAKDGFEVKKNQTTVTVSNEAAKAAVNEDGDISYYTSIDDAVSDLDSAASVEITVYGDDILSKDVSLPSGTTLKVDGASTLTVAENVKLTGAVEVSDGEIVAQSGAEIPEVENRVTVTFDANGGTCSVSAQVVEAGSTITMPNVSNSAYWYFQGWLSSADQQIRDIGDQVQVDADTTFTAQWAYVPPVVTDPSYAITTPVAANGTVTVSPTVAKQGDVVTITATPNEGYELGSLTVTDRLGNAVAVQANPNGTYSFVMPNSQVTITASFTEEAGETWVNPFVDVDTDDWYYDYVEYVCANGLMVGTSDVTFESTGTVTRGTLMTILARLDGTDTTDSDPWYQAGMEWAVAAGVSDGTAPEGTITREQVATMLWRYAGQLAVAENYLAEFDDADEIHDWAAQAMNWAVSVGVITGGDNGLDPQGTATRAELAAMLTRFCENVL